MTKSEKNTPMMQQYLKIKEQYKDAFLFYRLGDFYEMFYDDAIRGSKLMDLTLTQRNHNSKNSIPMCGVPYHTVQNYVNLLVEKGYKVAICEQIEDTKRSKGMIDREVVQLVTPGTLLDNSSTPSKDNNYLISIDQNSQNYIAFSYVDISTGELKSTVLHSYNNFVNEVISLRSKEIIINNNIDNHLRSILLNMKILISEQEKLQNISELSYLTQNISDEFEKKNIKQLLTYLNITQKRTLSHIQCAIHYEPSSYLKLDRFSIRNLDLIQNSRTGKKYGSLLDILDNTKTAMGGRLLKQWILRPLINKNDIEFRQKKVENLMNNFFERSNLQEELSEVYDLERLVSKISFGSVNGRDLIQLKISLSHVPRIIYILNSLNNDNIYNDLLNKIKPMDEITSLIEKSIVNDPPTSITNGNLIKYGYNAELDNYIDAMNNGRNWLSELESKERKLTGIRNLKIGFNKVFGYYIEVSKNNLNKIPERYYRKQTLVNGERFITPELKDKESLILGSESKSYDLQYDLFLDIREKIKLHIKQIQILAKGLAELDVLQGFANISEDNKYILPTLDNSHSIFISNGRHPIIEKVIGRQNYIPNDIEMDKNQRILLITGPNMSGKSTYMRQLALTVIMSQIGCFVPASSAKLPIFDKIFTRIGAADDLISGESTFMVEMKESNEALMNASENSLILFDEIGRGTSTYDGMALAQAIIEFIHNKVCAKTLFSTHYHELTVLDKDLKYLSNIHVGAVEKNSKLIFLHKIEKGPADKSYGIHVAKLAGLPDVLLKRASDILDNLEKKSKLGKSKRNNINLKKELEDFKQEDFKQEDFKQMEFLKSESTSTSHNQLNNTFINELRNLNLASMTPIDVMNKVYQWQQKFLKK